jgi:DNA polymerase-3 subunit alpha (Gram-positive type)
VEGSEVKGIFNHLIRPDSPVSELITNITGITQEMLTDAPRIEQVLPEFLDFIGNSPLVAHNSDFDVPFIQDKAKKKLGKDIKNQTFCTLQLSRALLPNLENHKLHTVAKYFNIAIHGRHRAIGDVEATYQVWLKLLDKLKEKNITTKLELEKFIVSNLRPVPY